MTFDLAKIKAAALAVTGWKLDHAWLDTSEDESSAVVGHIDEDGNEYAVITVDCDQYFQGQDSLPLAKYYAQANPSAVLELIERLEAAERDAENFRMLRDAMTFMDVDHNYETDGQPNVPVLASVSNRIWYHATDDNHSCTIEQVCEAMKEKP